MEEVLKKPTQKDTLLDLLLVNRADLVREAETGGHLGHSDYKAIKFKISVDRRKSASKTSTLDMKRADFRLLWELLDPYKSMGRYGIHPRILKELADVITKSLSMTFGQSRECGEVPDDWKWANIIAICKKEEHGNNRPVSLNFSAWILLDKMFSTQIDNCNVMGKQLARRLGTKSYREWGDIKLETGI
ncbi:hypothetical protein BTVI_59623 [Pitangus sulphuratus]|nr:hypothetical protein BTVI_59623 [Pitangus sulphuratus]